MSINPLFRPEADAEIASAVRYYDDIDRELGQDLRRAIQEAIERIRDNPELYAKLYGKVRPVTLRRFPFILSYVFEHEQVVVLGFVHASLPHEVWNRRRKN